MPDGAQFVPSHLPELPDAPETAAPPDDGACPRCGDAIIDPRGLGWCRGCGYCRSLEDERARELLAKTDVQAAQPSMAALAGHIPIWFWVLLLGVGAVFGGALALDWLLPPGNSFPRALWTSVQIGAGLLIILGSQVCVLIYVAHEDEKLGFKDALVPTRLWSVASRRLPRTAPFLWVATWGLCLVISALVFIGGLGHWYQYLPGAKDKDKNQTATKR